MKVTDRLKASWRNLFILVSGGGIFAIGAKMLSFLDNWVYLPSIPDVADFVFLLLASSYLVWCGLHEKKC